MKLQKEVGNLLEILNHMHKLLDESDDADRFERFCDTRFKVGFGYAECELPSMAVYFNAFEAFIKNLVYDVIEEEELDGEPYDSLREQYEKYNNY